VDGKKKDCPQAGPIHPLREGVFGGNASTLTGFPGNGGLDKVRKRFVSQQHWLNHGG